MKSGHNLCKNREPNSLCLKHTYYSHVLVCVQVDQFDTNHRGVHNEISRSVKNNVALSIEI